MTAKVSKDSALSKLRAQRVRQRANSKPRGFSGRSMAQGLLNPACMAAVMIHGPAAKGLDKRRGAELIAELSIELSMQIEQLRQGDLSRPEAMLLAQAHTLQSAYMTLMQLANKPGPLCNVETLMRLAFRAQNQCRATLETLLQSKNQAVFVKQANFSQAVQVNNGAALSGRVRPRACALENEHFRVLEDRRDKRLDSQTSQEAEQGDSPVEALVEKHRPAVSRRKGSRKP